MVNAGLVGAAIIDSHKAALWAEIFTGLTIHRDVSVSEGNAIGWAFRKNSAQLAKAVNEFVKTHREGTAFGNTLLRRYLRNSKWVRNSTSDQEMAKMRALIELFRSIGRSMILTG